MSYNSEKCGCHHVCEFTIPIKLHIPITIEPCVNILPVPFSEEKIPVVLEPDIYVAPKVGATETVCLPQNGYKREVILEEIIEKAVIEQETIKVIEDR